MNKISPVIQMCGRKEYERANSRAIRDDDNGVQLWAGITSEFSANVWNAPAPFVPFGPVASSPELGMARRAPIR